MLNKSQLSSLRMEVLTTGWADPFSGFNKGYRLNPMSAAPCRINARVYNSLIALPVSNPLSMFQLPTATISWIDNAIPLSNTWVSLYDHCNTSGTLFTVINPKTGACLDLRDCYIALVSGIHPMLVTPFVGGSLDVNITMSPSDDNHTITSFSLSGSNGDDVTRVTDSLNMGSMVYIDGKYVSADTIDDLPIPCNGYIVNRKSIKYVVQARTANLRTFAHGFDTYYILDVNIDTDNIYHLISMYLHIIDPTTKMGYTLDKTALNDNLLQVSGGMIAIRADYITSLTDLGGIDLLESLLEVHILESELETSNNMCMATVVDNVDTVEPAKLVTMGVIGTDMFSAPSLIVSQLKFNGLSGDVHHSDFDQHYIDSVLMAKTSSYEDSRMKDIIVSGEVERIYAGTLKYSKDTVAVSDYTLPVVYTASDELGVMGRDYLVTADGNITLINAAYVLDYSGAFHIQVERPLELIDLTSIPIINRDDVAITIIGDGIRLHEGIDYGIIDNQLIVWKSGVKLIDLYIYLSSYKHTTVGWVTKGYVPVGKINQLAKESRLSIYSGDGKLDAMGHRLADNGTPYTVESEVFTLIENASYMHEIADSRREFDNSLVSIASMYENDVPDDIPIGFRELYFLVSPLCVDALSAMRAGRIDPSMSSIMEQGVYNMLPQDIRAKYDSGYDPSTSDNMGGSNFVIIKAHDEDDMIEVSPDEWNFLRHISNTLLQGRVTLELYYRIVYE